MIATVHDSLSSPSRSPPDWLKDLSDFNQLVNMTPLDVHGLNLNHSTGVYRFVSREGPY